MLQANPYVKNSATIGYSQYAKPQMATHWQVKLDAERKQYNVHKQQPPIVSKVYGQSQDAEKTLQQLTQGNPTWAERMTKREVSKFVEYLLSRDTLHNTLNQKLIAELVNGNKTWADRLQKAEIVTMAEQLTGAAPQVMAFGAT